MKIIMDRSRELLTEQDIANLEKIVGASLPIDYKNFLLAFNGGHPNLKRFPLQNNPSDAHAYIDHFLCIKEKDIYNIFVWIRRFKSRVPSTMIPIAIDPGGNLICLSISGDQFGKVFFWDHEEEVEEGETPWNKNVYLITNSFAEFIESLDEG